jgi:hypothetical protein
LGLKRAFWGKSRQKTRENWGILGRFWKVYDLQLLSSLFCRSHRTLRVTPAMKAGITDHIWGIKDLLAFTLQV